MIYFAISILIAITIVGIILLRSITNEKRLFVFVPAGMVWGTTVYIFLLNIISKFLPGQSGIIFSTISLVLLGTAAYLITYTKRVKFEKLNLASLLLILCLILIVIYLSRLKMTSMMPSADADMQWAYAASFARGNYPLKASWQPDFNPNYHLGAYFLEGALFSLSKLPLITVRAMLNTYFLIAGSLFAIFIFWGDKYSFRNLWLIVAALVLYISFGVIIFIFPGQNFADNIILPSQAIQSLTKFPAGIIAKGTSGASLVDLNSLSFLPARSLSLGMAFLALYFSFIKFKNSKLRILSFALLFSTTALVEESMFLPLFAVTLTVFVISFFQFIPHIKSLKLQRKELFFIILITSILIIYQGGFFTDLISKNSSSFHINFLLFDSSFSSKLELLKNYFLFDSLKIFNWFLPSPFLFAILILIYSFFTQKRPLILLSLFSLISLACFLLIEYIYYPSNNIRFYNFSYIAAGTGIIYLIFTFLQSRSLRINTLVFFVFGAFVLIPTLLPELLNQFQQIKAARLKSIRSQILISSHSSTPFEQISDWAYKFLPVNGRLIVIDTDLPAPKRSLQFEYKGVYTILGPQNIRVLRQEPGPEYFDLALTLNPSLLKQTKTNYVYIESASLAYQQLPQSRKEELGNTNFFEVLQSIDVKDSKGIIQFYRLYKVKPAFLDSNIGGKDITDTTLQALQNLIPNQASVYIADYGESPKLSFWYRMAAILALKDKDIRRNLSLTDYMAIETSIPYKPGSLEEEYDYYLLGASQKPSFPAKLIWSNILASVWERINF